MLSAHAITLGYIEEHTGPVATARLWREAPGADYRVAITQPGSHRLIRRGNFRRLDDARTWARKATKDITAPVTGRGDTGDTW